MLTSRPVIAPHGAGVGTVPDIRSAVQGLVERGVAFQRYPGLEQDEHGVWAAPSGALVAWFVDPDGNTLSLTEFPPQSGG